MRGRGARRPGGSRDRTGGEAGPLRRPEREHDGPRALALGQPAHVGDDGLVAEVHAVVGADRDHGALTRPQRLIDIGDDLHGLRRYNRAGAADLVQTVRR